MEISLRYFRPQDNEGLKNLRQPCKTTIEKPSAEILERTQGCLLGQLAGDALGSLVEFQTPEQIQREYPNGVRKLVDGGTWNTIAGQPTDDSEMALLLARMLVDQGKYDPEEARKAYVYWLDSRRIFCYFNIARQSKITKWLILGYGKR